MSSKSNEASLEKECNLLRILYKTKDPRLLSYLSKETRRKVLESLPEIEANDPDFARNLTAYEKEKHTAETISYTLPPPEEISYQDEMVRKVLSLCKNSLPSNYVKLNLFNAKMGKYKVAMIKRKNEDTALQDIGILIYSFKSNPDHSRIFYIHLLCSRGSEMKLYGIGKYIIFQIIPELSRKEYGNNKDVFIYLTPTKNSANYYEKLGFVPRGGFMYYPLLGLGKA